MKRFVGVRNNKIVIVSDHKFSDDSVVVYELPQEFSDASSFELMTRVRVIDGKFVSKMSEKNISQMRIAFVGNWKMQCGISSYSENLWPAVAQHFAEFRLFVEKNAEPTSKLNVMGKTEIPESHVIQCWSRGESLDELVRQIQSFDPDIVWIQHEFGLWSNARHWLSMMSRLADFRVIVTMHSVFRHRDKTIVEAAMPEIVVHLEGAKHVLKEEKKLSNSVYVIPHGCNQVEESEKLWNFYRSSKTYMQFGFGFRYKGWEESIHAASILKQKYEDVFFTGLFSESHFAAKEHQLYYDELMELIERLGLQENVAIIRGYQSDEALDSFLRTNQASVFPYVSHPAHEVWGASGAARIAMSKSIPVITSRINHFSDIPSIKASTPQEIADSLEKLFLDWKVKRAQINTQNAFVRENSWEKVAQLYIQIFEKKLKY